MKVFKFKLLWRFILFMGFNLEKQFARSRRERTARMNLGENFSVFFSVLRMWSSHWELNELQQKFKAWTSSYSVTSLLTEEWRSLFSWKIHSMNPVCTLHVCILSTPTSFRSERRTKMELIRLDELSWVTPDIRATVQLESFRADSGHRRDRGRHWHGDSPLVNCWFFRILIFDRQYH